MTAYLRLLARLIMMNKWHEKLKDLFVVIKRITHNKVEMRLRGQIRGLYSCHGYHYLRGHHSCRVAQVWARLSVSMFQIILFEICKKKTIKKENIN